VPGTDVEGEGEDLVGPHVGRVDPGVVWCEDRAVRMRALLPRMRPAALVVQFFAMTFLWLACYAVAVAKMGDLLRRSPAGRALNVVTGSVLFALGVKLATEQP